MTLIQHMYIDAIRIGEKSLENLRAQLAELDEPAIQAYMHGGSPSVPWSDLSEETKDFWREQVL